MKKKFGSIWRVMVALVLVASLGLVFATPAGANGFMVTINTPSEGTEYHVGEKINVTATVTPPSSGTTEDVTVTLSWTGDAALVGGSTSYDVGDIPYYWSDTTVNWTLECTGPEDVTITVTAVATNGPSDSATVNVVQLTQEELTVTIYPPEDTEVCECTYYNVVAKVTNTGDFTIEDIDVTLTIDGDASIYTGSNPQNIGDLNKGEWTEVTWELHCDGGATGNCPSHDYVDLEVTAVGDGPASGIDGVTGSATYDNYVDQKWLLLEITQPADGAELCYSDDPATEFYVDVCIQNCFEEDVLGTLTLILDPASGAVIEDPGAVQENVTIPANSELCLSDDGGPIMWHLTCTQGGDLNITVRYLGIGDTTTICDEDSITIHQQTPGELDVELSAPSCVAYCQYFYVTADVTNTGGPDAAPITIDDVDLTVLSGDVNYYSGPGLTGDTNPNGKLDQDETWTYTWIYHCDGYADAEFEVYVDGEDDCGNYLEATDTAETMQIDLNIDITTDPSPPYRPSQEFCVTATLTNNEPEDTVTVDTVAIYTYPSGYASLVDGEDASKPVGDILPGESQEVSWTLHCDEEGYTYIDVYANITSPCTVTVMASTSAEQEYPPTTLKMDILSPDTGAKYATSQEFAVTAVVTNTGEQPAVGVVADIYGNGFDVIDAPGATEPGEPVMLGTLEPGDSETLTWTLHCNESGMTFIMVGTSAINLDGEQQDYCDLYDNTLVWQYPAAHLEVQILDDVTPEEIVTCNTFYVTAIIRNTGEADATEVYATLSVNPEGSVRVSADDPEGTYTKYVGTIPGHNSEDNYKFVTWNLHCKQACDSEITVTATGNDEYGWHIKQDSQTTGNFIIEHGALVSEQLENPYYEQYGYALPPVNRGWSYGFFVGDANGLAPGPFSVDTDLSMAMWGGGPDYLGHIVGMGFVVPRMEYPDYFESWIEYVCELDTDTLDLEGKDFMFWMVHIEMDSPYDMIGPWSEWCVGPGLIEVINGTITATWYKWNSTYGEWEDSLLGGTFHSNLAAEAGRAIPEKFIEPDGTTVKQVEPPTDADLAVEKVAGGSEFEVGEEVNFTITVINNGPADATGVRVTDLLPSGANYVSSTPGQGWYDVTSGIWHVGDLDVYTDATLTITAMVTKVGDISNIATVTACDQPDPTTSNNSAMATITGEAAPPVTSWEITVDEGYNLISLPLIPEDPAIDTMTADLEDLVMVYHYDALADPAVWLFYNPDLPFPSGSTLLTMEDGLGYWVKMPDPGTSDSFTFDGWELVAETDPPSVPPSYNVVEGWNLIGFKSTTPKLVSEYLSAIEGQYTIIYGYANGSFFIAGTAGHEYLEPGLGYWLAIKVGESGIIYP